MSESGEATEKTLDPAVQNGVADVSLDDVPGSLSPNKPTSSTPPSAESSPAASTLDSSSSEKPATFKENFKAFSKFGDTKSDGKTITLSQSDKWMKQAKVIDGKKITTTDTGIYFKKFKLQKLHLEEYEKYLADLGKNKKVELADMKKKMTECGPPGVSSAASATKNASTVDRLTDPSKYTGASKLRFDESGKGKGIAGRKDLPDKSGYVHGYKDRDSYNKTH